MTTPQQELFEPDFGWFHFFRTIIKNGTWAKMSLAAKALYPVVKSYAASKNGASFPSYDTLVEKSGISSRSVSKALEELTNIGMLTATKTVGKKTIYALKETFEVQHPVSGKTGTASFDYVPTLVKQAVEEMKALISTGANGKIIQINFNLNCHDIITNGINVDGVPMIDGGEAIQKILDSLDKKSEPVENP